MAAKGGRIDFMFLGPPYPTAGSSAATCSFITLLEQPLCLFLFLDILCDGLILRNQIDIPLGWYCSFLSAEKTGLVPYLLNLKRVNIPTSSGRISGRLQSSKQMESFKIDYIWCKSIITPCRNYVIFTTSKTMML